MGNLQTINAMPGRQNQRVIQALFESFMNDDGALNKKVDLSGVSGGAASASGLLMGTGTSASPATTSVASSIFMEFRTQSTATSGDSRSLYLRHDINGIAGGGEALRAFAKLSQNATTVRGAHISLDTVAAKGVSGLGAGVDAQVLVGNGILPAGGNYTALNLEWYAAGTSTAVSGSTQNSFMRCVLGGNATGAAAIEDDINLLTVTGGTNASGNVVGGAGNEPTWTSNTYLIRASLNGQAAFLVAVKT